MKKLLIATKNPGKFTEIREVLSGLDLELVFLGDLEVDDSEFVEDGETHKENAYKKAKFYSDKIGIPALGEDSGIYISALHGELGVKTRRWGRGEEASDSEWLGHFLKRLEREKDRSAKFVCWACLYGDGTEEYFEGETRGQITEKVQGPIKKGIPLSACFLAEGCDKVYSAMSEDEKNKVSHRGKALMGLRKFLE